MPELRSGVRQPRVKSKQQVQAQAHNLEPTGQALVEQVPSKATRRGAGRGRAANLNLNPNTNAPLFQKLVL